MGYARSLPFSTYAPRGRGVKSPIHFHCVLHAKRGDGVQMAFISAYVLNGRPPTERFGPNDHPEELFACQRKIQLIYIAKMKCSH